MVLRSKKRMLFQLREIEREKEKEKKKERERERERRLSGVPPNPQIIIKSFIFAYG